MYVPHCKEDATLQAYHKKKGKGCTWRLRLLSQLRNERAAGEKKKSLHPFARQQHRETEMQPKQRIYTGTEDHVTQKPLAVLSIVKKQFRCGILCNLWCSTEAFLISALRKTTQTLLSSAAIHVPGPKPHSSTAGALQKFKAVSSLKLCTTGGCSPFPWREVLRLSSRTITLCWN